MAGSFPYDIKYKRTVAPGYDENRYVVCSSTSFPGGVSFHLNVVENSLTFTNQLFEYNATPKKTLASGFSSFST